MAIANQGYRRDLNLKETTNDTVALDNLAGAGTADDLSYIQNNLRNKSSVSFNSITSDGFFSFENDRQITINGLSADGDAISTSIAITFPDPYLLKFGDFVELSGISESGATALNGQYSVSAVSPDLKTIFISKKGVNYTNPSMSISGVTFTLKIQDIFAFTNGDVVNLSEDVTFNLAIGGPTLTLASNIDYYVIEANGVNKFKLSTTESGTSVLPPAGVSGGTRTAGSASSASSSGWLRSSGSKGGEEEGQLGAEQESDSLRPDWSQESVNMTQLYNSSHKHKSQSRI